MLVSQNEKKSEFLMDTVEKVLQLVKNQTSQIDELKIRLDQCRPSMI